MVLSLMSPVSELVTMMSSSWTVLPAALVVALATWMWWNRGRSREKRQKPETPSAAAGSGDRDRDRDIGNAVEADIERANLLEFKETRELKVGVQPPSVKQKSFDLESKDILDTLVSNQRENDFVPELSKKQDWSAAEQTNDTMQIEPIAQPTSDGESPVHVARFTEYSLGQEKKRVCEKLKPSLSTEEVFNQFDHGDKALDLASAVEQKFDGTDSCLLIQTNNDSSETSADVPSNLNIIETKMEKDKKKSIKLVFKDESERTAASLESENTPKKVAAVSPLPVNNVSVSFNVHYVTCSNSQILAVTGNHECLGQWENYVPLKPGKDGFWSNSILLPVNLKFEWKYVVVENGKIWRWEECPNRWLETSHEDMEMYQCWGYL
ncbi:uncharacterized protein stbd1 [Rhinoraja longicauda]